MCLILRWFYTGTFSRRKVQGLQRGLLKGRIGTINCKTFGTAFKEWTFCQYKLDEICLMDCMKCHPVKRASTQFIWMGIGNCIVSNQLECYLGWQMAACASATTGEEVEQIKLIVIFHGLVPVSIFWRAICFKDESAW